MSAPELAAEIRALSRRFGERTALDSIDLDIGPGQVFGLLGPNGSGKSTLFRILSTLIPPTGGSARIFGIDILADPDAVRGKIGVVFQSPSLDRKLTVAENLHYQGHLYGLSGAALRRRASELLGRFGLAERARERVENLSGGLARRVEIAKGMLHRPGLLLLDEPSTGLDPAARRSLSSQLAELRDSDGVTVLLTTHLLEEADACDLLALLDAGRVVARGTPSELKGEVSGSAIYLETSELPAIRAELRERLGLEARLADTRLYVEHADPYGIARRISEVLGDRVDAITIGKPTLAEAFLARTGHSLGEDRTP